MSANSRDQRPHLNGSRPRLVGRLSVVPSESGLVVYSGSRRLAFNAARTASASVIQKILTTLDGNHDHAHICAESGVEQRDLDQALNAFEQAGLLEWDREGDNSGYPAADVRDYVSGSLVRPSGYESSHEIRDMLAATAVILVCAPGISAAASADLRRIGLGAVVAAETVEDAAKALAATSKVFTNGVVVCQEDCGDSARLERTLKELMLDSWPILRCQVCPGRVELGPVFIAGYPCCTACFRSARDCPATPDRTGLLDGALLRDPNFAAALLVNRLVSLLVGDRGLNSWDRTTWTLTAEDVVSSTRFAVVPDVGCADCGWGVTDAVGDDVRAAAQSALTSECLAESWPGTRVGPAGHAPGPATAPSEAKDSTPRHRGYLPTEVLDWSGPAAEPAGQPSPRSYEQQLIAVLLRAAGDALEQCTALAEENGIRLRQAGSTHGSTYGSTHGWVIPYLLAPDDIFKIPGSIFRYDHQANQIISVNSERQSLARYRDAVDPCDGELCRGPDRRTPRRCLAIIFAGIGSSREWENSVAWRWAHLRTGYVLNDLAALAQASGVRLFARAAVNQSALAEMLELWPGREVITAAVEISLKAGGPECR